MEHEELQEKQERIEDQELLEDQEPGENQELLEDQEPGENQELLEDQGTGENQELLEDQGGHEACEAQEMSRAEKKAAIEAILFATGRAVSRMDLARALETDAEEIEQLAAEMSSEWSGQMRGVELAVLEDSYQMCTCRAYYPQLIKLELTPKKPRLTDVTLETLSVIAYKQPVTKAEIERIRGVNSDHAVNKLIEYHLVTELGRAKQPGRPILFGTTQEFLRVFGVSSKENLPEISPVKMADFREEAEEEAGIDLPGEESPENPLSPEQEEIVDV